MCLCVCFPIKLLWYFEALHGLFSTLCGALAYQNLLSWERGIWSQPIHMEGETGAVRKSAVISTLHKPYLETRWGLTSTFESSCQQTIQASLSSLPLLTENKHREPCILLQQERSFHYAPSLWFQQLISSRRASPGPVSGCLCGLAVIALWVKAQLDHTGLAVVQPITGQWNGQNSPQCLCQISQVGYPLVDLGPVTTIIMWNVCFLEATVTLQDG